MSRSARILLRSATSAAIERSSDLDTDLLGLTALGGGEPGDGPYTGIKALMLAVLDNGIAGYLSTVPRIRAEAEYWVIAAGQRSPFSFNVVCETLRLEPDAVRGALRRMRERGKPARRTLVRRRPNVRREGRLLASKRTSPPSR